MSIPVDIGELARVRASFGAGYLITVGPGGRPKVVTVEPGVVDGVLLIDAPGRGSVANAEGGPEVTVVFPPPEAKGFTLLVDGHASVHGDQVRVHPTSAVLHRPATHADGPPAPSERPGAGATGCEHDCRPL